MITETRQASRLDQRTYALLHDWTTLAARGKSDPALLGALMSALSELPAFAAEKLQQTVRNSFEYAQWRKVPERPTSLLHRFSIGRKSGPVQTQVELASDDNRIYWLYMLHGNGYIRETALGSIHGVPPGPAFLAALLMRLNDNASPVRNAAATCLRRLSGELTSDVIAAVVPYYLEQNLFWQRIEARTLVEEMISTEPVLASMKSTLAEGLQGWLPRFFNNLLATDLADEWLPELAIYARHVAIRARALTVLMEGKVDKLPGYREVVISERLGSARRVFSRDHQRRISVAFGARAMIGHAAGDRSVKVRKTAAQGLILHYQDIQDIDGIIACFGRETNKAVLERLDFVRRHVAQGAQLPPDAVC